jgi:hypothetical protein
LQIQCRNDNGLFRQPQQSQTELIVGKNTLKRGTSVFKVLEWYREWYRNLGFPSTEKGTSCHWVKAGFDLIE